MTQKKSNMVKLMQTKGEKTFEYILSSALYNLDLNSSDITLPAFGKPVNATQDAA